MMDIKLTIDEIISMTEQLAKDINLLTSGNVSHNKAVLSYAASVIADNLKSIKEDQ